jgi:hypothetical protein
MIMMRRALAISLALGAVPASLLIATAPAQAQPGTQVNGYNVSYVAFDRGSFRQDGKRWTEYDINNRPVFTFDETGRDDWSVYLYDRSRNVRLQLDLHRRKIGYGENDQRVSDLYDIVSARTGRIADIWPFRDGDRARGQWSRRAETRWVNAGPIWNRQDAAMKCPVAAYAVEGRWTGEWRTTRQGQMSVCEIGW